MPGREYIGASTEEQNKFKFMGKERDKETGYDYVEARYYDSAIGRFLQVDPLAEDFADMNAYNYAFNNPVLWNDPSGKCPWCIGAVVGGLVDLGFQTLVEGKSLGDVNWTSVGVSMGAGALGNVTAGAVRSGLTNVASKVATNSKKVQTAINVTADAVTDAAASVAGQIADGNGVSLENTLIDVGAGGLIGNSKAKTKMDSKAKQLKHRAKADKNIAAKATREGRKKAKMVKANSSKKTANRAARRAVGTGVAGSGVAGKGVNKLVDKTKERLGIEQ